jgi:hypothetical protein
MSELLAHPGPDWVVAEMPPGYQNRLVEIQRLAADLQDMGRFARLLCAVGPPLGEAVRDVFTALKFDTELVPANSTSNVTVRLDGNRRLLLIPSATTEAVQKKSPEVAQVFQMLQDVAEEPDRVVLVTNVDPDTRPADRPAAVTPDALAFLVRMGARHVAGSTLFNLWKLSHEGLDRAREQVERLHAHDAGTFELPASALR